MQLGEKARVKMLELIVFLVFLLMRKRRGKRKELKQLIMLWNLERNTKELNKWGRVL